jgi:hypothetical protein
LERYGARMKKPYDIFTLRTKKKAIKAFVANGKVCVVVNEKIFRGSETYVIEFDAEELINWKLRKLHDLMKGS